MPIKYLVVEKGYEYNDENYFEVGEDGVDLGTPIRLFSDRDKAEARAKELNERARETHDYLYEQREYDRQYEDIDDLDEDLDTLIEVFFVVEVEEE